MKTPPFSKAARHEVGMLFRRLPGGEMLGMPHSRPMPSIGLRCHELRIPDGEKNWRIFYRIDTDAIVLAEVFHKTTQETPKTVIDRCKARFKRYDQDNCQELTPMDPAKRKRLEAAGWKAGDFGDFLELADAERQLIEFRYGLAKAVRAGREAKGWTQKELATAIGSSQSRVAKLESFAQDVTVDLMLRALFTVGGRLPEMGPVAKAKPKPKRKRKEKTKTEG